MTLYLSDINLITFLRCKGFEDFIAVTNKAGRVPLVTFSGYRLYKVPDAPE